MNRTPNELLDRIIEAADDEVALVVLSCASRRLYIQVSSRQRLWRERFQQQFSQSDDKEQAWLLQYKRACWAEVRIESIDGRTPILKSSFELNWFDIYCKRRAVEYRWRRGKYTVHRLENVADTLPDGIRLQSILHRRIPSAANDVVVASQWKLVSQKQSIWLFERLCWKGVDTDHAEILDRWNLGEYLAIHTHDQSRSRYHLHFWHFAALHRPPRTVVVDWNTGYELCQHGEWIVGRYVRSRQNKQWGIFAYHLAKGVYCADTLRDESHCYIQHATTDTVRIFMLRYDQMARGPLVADYELWQVTLSQTASFQWQAAGQVAIKYGTFSEKINQLRADADRLVLWSSTSTAPSSAMPPNLVLLEIADGAVGASLKEKWSSRVSAEGVRSIASHNLLGVWNLNTISMLSLADGSEVYRVQLRHLDCWDHSGLYPPVSQWTAMVKDQMWRNPRLERSLNLRRSADHVSSPTATLYRDDDGDFVLIDYTVSMRRPKPITLPPATLSQPLEKDAVQFLDRQPTKICHEQEYLVAENKRLISENERLIAENKRLTVELQKAHAQLCLLNKK
ncbi:hypothetical protein THASP1DRAFT_31856 [Thamnocephalis sphaerospora]|uniref:F-box domain-containing protein n=1 Tax=Thamnocephalis sphaerospora TaxID=78915 RepID=A0A4P9XKN4_9FUNG|nr:hypothetical protein THASP1DRAFT_31856 [Thamnocephalis sphaerospora]|eukprot:RKP06322.1 hypothetical protein THASP1DRAFT_31856 [Thamnocephalis sphaerospora]